MVLDVHVRFRNPQLLLDETSPVIQCDHCRACAVTEVLWQLRFNGTVMLSVTAMELKAMILLPWCIRQLYINRDTKIKINQKKPRKRLKPIL